MEETKRPTQAMQPGYQRAHHRCTHAQSKSRASKAHTPGVVTAVLQAIKNWTVGRPGNEASTA